MNVEAWKRSVICFHCVLMNRSITSDTNHQRFGFIDGLRGVAALAVMIHHIIWFTPWDFFGSDLATEWVYRIGYWGKCGVPVFFVISGFVIAHSLRKAAVTPKFVGTFFLRRSMRLDPPYWCTIAVMIAISYACMAWTSIEPPTALPKFGQLVAHAFYLQNLLGYENVSVGFWTLCIEIQFYMMFVVMLGLAQFLSQRSERFCQVDIASPNSASTSSLIAVFAPVMLASLFTFTYLEQLDNWFLRYYCLFCLGACLSASRCGMIPKWIAWIAIGLFAIRVGIEYQRSVFSGLVVGGLILFADARGGLSTWLMSRMWQYLGKISYSLYLIHYPVVHLIMHFGKQLSGDNVPMIYVWMTVSLFASIAVGAVLYRVVEAPSIALASSFSKRVPRSASPEFAQPEVTQQEFAPGSFASAPQPAAMVTVAVEKFN